MELTLIVAGLLAAVAGLVSGLAAVARSAAAHKEGLAAAGRRAADRARLRRLLPARRMLPAAIRVRVPPGWFFSLSVAAGLIVIALGAIAIGALVEDVTDGGGVAVLDHPVAGFVVTHRSGALTAVLRPVSIAGSPVVLAVVAVVAGALLGFLRRSWEPVVLASVTVAGTGVLTAVFKEVLGRSRPPLADAVAAADGYAFPSGHAAAAAAACGVLAWLCTALLRSWAGRVAAWAVAAVLAALVGISRVYLGVHWTTDVIGGWVVGVVWLAVVLTGWTAFTRERGQGAP